MSSSPPSLVDDFDRIARSNERVVVVVCFLFVASHVKHDVTPRQIQSAPASWW